MDSRDDLFVINCLKEVSWPYGDHSEGEMFLQDNAGQLLRTVRDTEECAFACAHEFLASRLGRKLGLAIPQADSTRFAQRERLTQEWSRDWMVFSPSLFSKLPSRAQLAASVLVFDYWLGNRRRHVGNLFLQMNNPEPGEAGGQTGREISEGTETGDSNSHPPKPSLLLVRHDFCFMGVYDAEDEGGAFDPIPPETIDIAAGHPMAPYVTDQMDFEPILSRIEDFEPDDLRDFLRLLPGAWMTASQKTVVHKYLVDRAASLRGQLNDLKPFCSNW